MREVDAVGVQLAQALNTGVGGTRGERARVLRRLTDDEHETVAGADRHRLMPGRMARRRENADAIHDLAIAFDGFVARVREVDPLDDRLAFLQGAGEAGLPDGD